MDISDLTLKLIIILLPGALSAKIIQKITVHKPWSDFQFTVNSILLGVASYLLLQVLYILITSLELSYCNRAIAFEVKSLQVWQGIQQKGSIPYPEVFFSGITAIFVALIVSKMDHTKFLNKSAQKHKISNKYGDEDLYSYFLNAKEIKEVYVRLIKYKLTYHGYVDSFSETDNIKELTLRDVTVYNYPESEEMYNLNYIYLSLAKDDVIIENLTSDHHEEGSGQAEDDQTINGGQN